MKGNEGPKRQMKKNEGQKGQKLQNAAGFAADKICLNLIRKRTVFGNLQGGGPTWQPLQAKKKKWKPKRLKWKEMKA